MEDGMHYKGQVPLGRDRNGSWSSHVSSSSTLTSDVELDDLEESSFHRYESSKRPLWRARSRANSKTSKTSMLEQRKPLPTRRGRSKYHRLCRLAMHTPYLLIGLLVVTGVFFPSYTIPPRRYQDLRRRVLESTREGAANPHNEKIFIAASLYDKDGELLRGDWGRSVLHLIDMLGHNNVFVSLYENDPTEDAMLVMSDFRQRLPCASAIVHEHLDTSELHHVMTTDGTQRLKRMAFLADVRNRALQPLEDEASEAYNTTWDKLLYLNDVVFDPVDAANLLLNTNVDWRTGRTNYRAACSVDFSNPFKFYDTFATRDLEGYEMGVPFFPWFTNAGGGHSRQDVRDQKDAVRVKSCWGGMVAFEAKWFQQQHETQKEVKRSQETNEDRKLGSVAPTATKPSTTDDSLHPLETHLDTSPHANLVRSTDNTDTTFQPLRFRSEPDTFWAASECCLIHADLAHRANPTTSTRRNADTGIYMNPFIRVAYSGATLAWLPFTRRFERLYPHVHRLVNWIGQRPGVNPRQFERPGEEVVHRVWQWDERVSDETVRMGRYVDVETAATPGMFCGTRQLQVIKTRTGGKNWANEVVPDVPSRR